MKGQAVTDTDPDPDPDLLLDLDPDRTLPGSVPFVDLVNKFAVLLVEETQVPTACRVGKGREREVRVKTRTHANKKRKIGYCATLPFYSEVFLHG